MVVSLLFVYVHRGCFFNYVNSQDRYNCVVSLLTIYIWKYACLYMFYIEVVRNSLQVDAIYLAVETQTFLLNNINACCYVTYSFALALVVAVIKHT